MRTIGYNWVNKSHTNKDLDILENNYNDTLFLISWEY